MKKIGKNIVNKKPSIYPVGKLIYIYINSKLKQYITSILYNKKKLFFDIFYNNNSLIIFLYFLFISYYSL